jgi:2-polyprenyl-3-methyl-5-hydroxy-6-metoxy-1,4-benzoquinol methylase
LESISLIASLSEISFSNVLEIGCGTGKNTVWMQTKAKRITAIDITESMIAKARIKVDPSIVSFIVMDVTKPWEIDSTFDLVTCSLVLEHVEDLSDIFAKISILTSIGSYVYIGELHPFKQYAGTKARFSIDGTQQIVACFTHHLSDFTAAASKYNFRVVTINEWFDDNDKTTIPRILSILFIKT